MPAGDRTGPMGQGPRTGRGLGNCPAVEGAITANDDVVLGRGRGDFGRGMGRGCGFGRGRGFGPGPYNPQGNNE